ncbi:hypothetical protein BKG91_02505 [Rodentibacter caecimuris]|uniref:Uncharacterized protein n=1 Tax=Rodentibacter caecimuris TaxID=1796644 RepID=A0A9X8VXP8_9PAST|nr:MULTISPECIES: hypothetical protein [Pasteurellaceae]AOF53572.1 hypothetical protein AC062_1480 [Pasteurellaceae bacterium NI1060]MCR1837689.1 hypothetical protein [Pasteurella caecimuris]MCU0106627.1 hypothetical protein [Pasteurella caecimuris]OOF72052.1 hypothetical protein BKG90_06015 [Rodentibacter heylii]OOF75726.1 hypothetical protein BKG91_02505 [Rodentibacter heylii]
MIKKAFTFALAIAISLGATNSAIAREKKKSSGIIKKAVVAYVAYKVYKHYKDKKEEQKAKSKQKETYVEPVYYDEDCESEDECEEE